MLWLKGLFQQSLLAFGGTVRAKKEERDPIATGARSSNSKRIATGGSDGMLKLWSVTAKACTVTLRGHKGPVSSATFSPDGNALATAGADATIRLWRAATGEEIRAAVSPGALEAD